MDYKDFSKWLWDIVKYVVTAIIITTFLGKFRDDTFSLYTVSFVTVGVLIGFAIYFYKLSKRK